jgi:hypothetical protein
MLVKPVLIIGVPRSGTSLLQKILRDHPVFWSLPSESGVIWNRFCHPRLREWESECMHAEEVTPEAREYIPRQFEKFICPAHFWRPIEKTNMIWGSRRRRYVRKWLGWIYHHTFPMVPRLFWHGKAKRLVDKTTSNCFSLGYVNEIFPDAKIVYPVRDGRNNVNSLINGWLHPTRFFSYDVPVTLRIKDYPYKMWKFVLPPGWQHYVDRTLEEVCAFQWHSCHEAMLAETVKSKYEGRVLRLNLECLGTASEYWLRQLAEFVELPYDAYFQSMATHLPVINSPDNDTSANKWAYQHREKIERILPIIEPTMRQLGYEI